MAYTQQLNDRDHVMALRNNTNTLALISFSKKINKDIMIVYFKAIRRKLKSTYAFRLSQLCLYISNNCYHFHQRKNKPHFQRSQTILDSRLLQIFRNDANIVLNCKLYVFV